MLREKRAFTSLMALACTAGVLFPVAAQASDGVCVGRKVTLAGGDSNDPLAGTSAIDVLAGLGGHDSLAGAAGDDRLCGGEGNDLLSGDEGSDLLRGNAGDDVLIGGEGSDRLNGGPGNDICELGPGDRSSGGCEATLEEDSDRDGLPNATEIALRTNAFAADSDRDGTSDLDETAALAQAALDGDGDSILDEVDNCPGVANTDQANLDGAMGDAEGDACDGDDDGDGVADDGDNCPAAGNADQANLDKDALGDACDEDLDGDQILNAEDLCPTKMHGDRNYGGCPPLVPGDSDQDSSPDGRDNCDIYNPDQADTNGDGIGDACQDQDGDLVPDHLDNCPDFPNTGQSDVDDKDGIGDACDLPTFFEFYAALVSILGPCPLGPVCEPVVLGLYQLIFGQPPPPYTLPPGFFGPACICIPCPPVCIGPGIIVI